MHFISVFGGLRRAPEGAGMWRGNHIATHNSGGKQSSKDAAAEISVPVPSCVMISTLSLPSQIDGKVWEDGNFAQQSSSRSLLHLKLSFRPVILDLVLWRWDSSEYCSIHAACRK